jgi:hypothetical protein
MPWGEKRVGWRGGEQRGLAELADPPPLTARPHICSGKELHTRTNSERGGKGATVPASRSSTTRPLPIGARCRPGTPALERSLAGGEYLLPVVAPLLHVELVEQQAKDRLEAHSTGRQMQAGELPYLGVQMRMRVAVGTALSILRVPVPQDELVLCGRVDPVAVGQRRDLPRSAVTGHFDEVVLLLEVQPWRLPTSGAPQPDRLLGDAERLDMPWPWRPIDQPGEGHAGESTLQRVDEGMQRLVRGPAGQARYSASGRSIATPST